MSMSETSLNTLRDKADSNGMRISIPGDTEVNLLSILFVNFEFSSVSQLGR
jgi:hypothetical protein